MWFVICFSVYCHIFLLRRILITTDVWIVFALFRVLTLQLLWLCIHSLFLNVTGTIFHVMVFYYKCLELRVCLVLLKGNISVLFF